MKKLSQRRAKAQEPKLTPNKEFLVKFFEKNFARQRLSERRIKGFNFFLIKQCNRIAKTTPSIDSELEVVCKLFLTLIANLEENVKNSQLIPYLNDSFYMLVELFTRSLLLYSEEKVLKAEQWATIESLLELFPHLQKWQNIVEADLVDMTERQLVNLNWVDELPEIEKNPSTVLTEGENLAALSEWCCLDSIDNHYYALVRRVFELFVSREDKKFGLAVLGTLRNALEHKKSGVVDKAAKLYCSVGVRHAHEILRNIDEVLRAVDAIDEKQKGVRMYREVLEALPIEQHYSAEMILDLILRMLKEEEKNAKTEANYKEVHRLFVYLARLSVLMTEIIKFDTQKLKGFIDTVVAIAANVKEKPMYEIDPRELMEGEKDKKEKILQLEKKKITKEWQESICLPLSTIVLNIKKNPLLLEAIKLEKIDHLLAQIDLTQPDLQKLLLLILPNLTNTLPSIPSPSASAIAFMLHLKLVITYSNSHQNIPEVLDRYIQRLQSSAPTNFDFACCYCLLQGLQDRAQLLEQFVDRCVRMVEEGKTEEKSQSLLLNLLMITTLMNPRDYPILRLSTKEMVAKLLEKPERLKEPLSFPPLVTNQAFLFSKYVPTVFPSNLQKLTLLLNRNIDKFGQANLELFYYILIELNNLCTPKEDSSDLLEKPEELKVISRMRLNNNSTLISYAYHVLEKAVNTRNNIEVFHSLVRILCISEGNTAEEDNKILTDLQSLLLELLSSLHNRYRHSYRELVDIYSLRRKKELCQFRYSQFMQYSKDMQVVKFYSEARQELHGKLHTWIMQVILQILLKINGKQELPQSDLLTQTHLLYLPIESQHLSKDIVDSPLFLTYVMMGIYSSSPYPNPEPKFFEEIKSGLEADLPQIIQLSTDSPSPSSSTQVVKFQNFDFVETLIDNLFLDGELGLDGEDIFCFKMLNSLMDGCPVLASQVVEQFKLNNLLEKKLLLAKKRIEKIFKERKYELLENSKVIYQLLGRINREIKDHGWFNQYIHDICGLDQMTDMTFSINLLKELIQLTPILNPDEQLAANIFLYLAKFSEFYKEQNKDELLVLIPRLVCTLFGVVVVHNDQKQPLQAILQDMERNEKSSSVCLNSGALSSQSYFRCFDCDEKKILCQACTTVCHNGHAVILAMPSSFANKHPCQCSAISPSQCKLRRPPGPPGLSAGLPGGHILIKKEGSLGGGFYRDLKLNNSMFGLPPPIHAPILPPTSTYAAPLHPDVEYQPFQTIRMSSYSYGFSSSGTANNPFQDSREPQFDRFTRIDRYAMEPDCLEDDQEMEFFESPEIKRARGRPQPPERREPDPGQQNPQQEEDDLESEQYEELRTTKMETEAQPADSLIRGQSYLLQTFLQIAQDLCLSKGRKASLVENQNWKFTFGPAMIGKLVDFSVRPFPPNSFKTRLNAEGRDVALGSPMIYRKPIAVSPSLTLILNSTLLYVFKNKSLLTHLALKSQLEQANQHGLAFEGHSVEFCPNNPNQFCVAGLHSMHVLTINPEDGTVGKATPLVTFTNRNEYINKLQYLEIGVLIGDSKSWKLISGKTATLVIHAAKDGGIIRDWCVMKLEERKFVVPTYLLVAITSYENVYTLQFDENDKGDKHVTNKLFVELKKKDPGSAINVGYLPDGRKYALFGFKDKRENNNIGRLESNRIENIASLKFHGSHPAYEKHVILGAITRVPLPGQDKLMFCCTLKTEINKDLSIQSGQLTLFSLGQDEKFCVQPLTHLPTDTNCEGFAILPIDESANCIISLHEDGSVNMFVQGELKKDSVTKLIKDMDEKEPTKKSDAAKTLEQIRRVILDKIKLVNLAGVELAPLIDFRERALEPLRKGTDYSAERKDDELSLKLENSGKIITGLAFAQSSKVTLPTRVVDNALEVGFSNLEVLYFHSLGKFKVKVEKLNNGATNKERRLDRLERLDRFDRAELLEQEAEMELLMKKGYSRAPSMGLANEYEVYGENAENFLQRFKKLADLVSEPKSDPATAHIKEIFFILEIFLKEIRDTQNLLMEQEDLMAVVDSFKPLLLKVECDYYEEVKMVIELCLEIINGLNGNPHPRIGTELDPKTFTLEPLIKQLQNQPNCTYLLNTLYEMSIHDPQRYFFWISKYRQLVKKLYKKHNLLFVKDDKFKDKEQERPVEEAADRLLCLLIASYNILVAKNEPEGETLMNLIKSIFTKYAGNRTIRGLMWKYLVHFYKIKPEPWLEEVVPVEEGTTAELLELIAEDKPIKEIEHFQPADLYAEMDEETMIKLAMDENEKLLLQQQRFLQGEDLELIEEHKEDYEDMGEMVPAEVSGLEDLKDLDGNLIARDMFSSCMRSFKTDETMDTARYSIMVGYVLFRAIDKVQPSGVVVFTREILKWLAGVKVDKQHSLTTLCFMSLFSKIIEESTFVSLQPAESKYAEIKQQVLEKARQIVSMDPHPNKKIERVKLSVILKNKSVNDTKLSFAHSLLGLLRGPVELDPVILSLKCYWLLPKPKEEYKKERDRVIYQECMLSEDISKIYKRAKKRPDTWRQSANIEWLEKFIEQKKPGWTQALELLALYYDA